MPASDRLVDSPRGRGLTSAAVANPPEYRPFRRAAAALYIAAAVFVGLCILSSGFLGARQRMGVEPAPAPLASVDPPALRRCLIDLEGLFNELNDRMEAALQSSKAHLSSQEWEDWSPGWRQRVLDTGARCRLSPGDVPGSQPVAEAFRRLLELHRHYTTLAVQFSKEIGPFAEQTRQALEQARGAVAP